MQAIALRRLQLEADIKAAIHNQDFKLVYQPIVDLVSGEILGFESLLRWPRKDVLIPPAGTRVTGFKEIRYMPYHLDDKAFDQTMDFMASSFPDARILFNTRDGSEVCKSGMWTDKQRFNPRDVKRWVVEADKRFHRWNEKLGDRAFLIDYAQFNRKPEGFYPLIEWLGEDLSPERVKEISTQRLKHVRNHGDKPNGMKAKLRGLLKA